MFHLFEYIVTDECTVYILFDPEKFEIDEMLFIKVENFS